MDKVLRWFARTPVALMMAALYGLFTAFVLIPKSAEVKAYTRDAGSIDLSFGFNSPETVYAMAEAYGEAGRQAYIFDRVSFDVIWPLVYTVFYLSWIVWTLRIAHGDSPRVLRWGKLAIWPILLDFGENSIAVLVMSLYPTRLDAAVYVLSTLTMLKWASIGVTSLLLGYGILAAPVQAIRRALAPTATRPVAPETMTTKAAPESLLPEPPPPGQPGQRPPTRPQA